MSLGPLRGKPRPISIGAVVYVAAVCTAAVCVSTVPSAVPAFVVVWLISAGDFMRPVATRGLHRTCEQLDMLSIAAFVAVPVLVAEKLNVVAVVCGVAVAAVTLVCAENATLRRTGSRPRRG